MQSAGACLGSTYQPCPVEGAYMLNGELKMILCWLVVVQPEAERTQGSEDAGVLMISGFRAISFIPFFGVFASPFCMMPNKVGKKNKVVVKDLWATIFHSYVDL